MKKLLVLIIAIWSILVSGSFVWNYLNAQKERERISFQTASTFFNQIVLPNTPIEGALFVAEKIRSNIENLKIEHKASPVHTYVTLSLGAATYYSGDISYKALIEDTDEALYRAKANGRNRVEAFK